MPGFDWTVGVQKALLPHFVSPSRRDEAPLRDGTRVQMFVVTVSGGECLETLQMPTAGKDGGTLCSY